eukprot:7853137-Prorocentrum_lima.AAC.1
MPMAALYTPKMCVASGGSARRRAAAMRSSLWSVTRCFARSCSVPSASSHVQPSTAQKTFGQRAP